MTKEGLQVLNLYIFTLNSEPPVAIRPKGQHHQKIKISISISTSPTSSRAAYVYRSYPCTRRTWKERERNPDGVPHVHLIGIFSARLENLLNSEELDRGAALFLKLKCSSRTAFLRQPHAVFSSTMGLSTDTEEGDSTVVDTLPRVLTLIIEELPLRLANSQTSAYPPDSLAFDVPYAPKSAHRCLLPSGSPLGFRSRQISFRKLPS